MKRILLFSIVILSIFFLIAIFTPFSGVQEKDNNVLYIYSWSGNSNKAIIKQFEKETGIRVVVDFYDSNDVLEAKLLTGKTNYDIVSPSVTPNYIRQIGMGIYLPLDKKKLKNYHQLDPKIMKLIAQFDVGNQFGVPYALGTTGFAYVENKVNKVLPEGLPNSLKAIFDKNYIEKLSKCGVVFLDQAQDILEAAQAYSGYAHPSCMKDDQLNKSVSVVQNIREHVKTFTTNVDMIVTQLATGEICLAHIWSNDAFLAQQIAKQNNTGVTVKYMIPKEWPALWIDMIAIPKSAPHPDNAHKFIDFILRPEIAAQIIQETYMDMPNLGARAILPREIKDNPAIFTPADILDNLRLQKNLSIRQERKMMREWTRVKMGW